MYLEPNRDDRDYLYGRLLALADNFEESVLRKQGVKDRPTNAIKLMSNFTAKPYTTWGTLWKQLMPYLKSANGGSWFRNEVDDVMALFKYSGKLLVPFLCRSPYGERGLKSSHVDRVGRWGEGRSPYGERGLKYLDAGNRRAWTAVALLTESVD